MQNVEEIQKKSGYHHGNLKQALIDASIKVLEEEGIEALSLRRSAREANVSQAAPYSHFRDKRDLLAATAEVGFQRLALKMVEDAIGTKTVLERLEKLSLSYINFAMENQALFYLMFGREIGNISDYPTLAMTAGKGYALISGAISNYYTENKITDKDPKAVTASIWGMVHGLASLLVDQKLKIENIEADTQEEFVQKIFGALKGGVI